MSNSIRLAFTLICVVSASWARPGNATVIAYELTALGGNSYRYVYSVTNDGSLGSGIPILLFDTLFEPADYLEASLTIVTPAPLSTQWSELVLGSAPGVPAAYDALAQAGGVADGAIVAGFSIEFEWLGVGRLPGSQPFQIYDPETFALLENGVTVPEPQTLWLLALGLAALATRRAQKS